MSAEIGFRYCQSMDGGFAAWTHEQETLFLVQGESIPDLEKALGAALSMWVGMKPGRTAPLLVHLSRSDSGGSIAMVGNTGEALLGWFEKDPARRFVEDGFLGVRLETQHLCVVAPRGVMKPELLGHLVHALRERNDSRVDPPWDSFLERWLGGVKGKA